MSDNPIKGVLDDIDDSFMGRQRLRMGFLPMMFLSMYITVISAFWFVLSVFAFPFLKGLMMNPFGLIAGVAGLPFFLFGTSLAAMWFISSSGLPGGVYELVKITDPEE